MKNTAQLAFYFGFVVALSLVSSAAAAESGDKGTPTHQQSAEIKVIGADGQTRLQTLSIDPDGRVLALVAPPRGYGAPTKNGFGEVQVFTPEGKHATTWKVGFHAHSINVGPDGAVFVAGDGRVARFDKNGKSLGESELPHIADLLKDKDTLRKRAEEQLKQQKESFEGIVKQYKERKEKLEAKPATERTDAEKKLLEQYEQILKSYAETTKFYESRTVDQVLGEITGRLRIINGIAVSKKDVFIACGETKGFGYAIWRLDHDLKNPKQVLSSVGGCCGQMDIQTAGEDLLVAENTRHRFARYTRDGKAVGAWGKRGKETEVECFGGCCNPMNLRAGTGGVIFTAESEGIVKKFSDQGEFLGLVGTAKLQGGCKNVAVAVSPDASKVYFCDQPGSRIIVLSKK